MQKHFAKLIGLALGAAVTTALIPFFLMILFGAIAPSLLPYESSGPVPKIEPGTAYTKEDLEKAARDTEARMNASTPTPTKAQIVDSVRNGLWWCTWIPWIAIPFLINIRRHPVDLLALLTPLILITSFAWIKPVEGLLAGAALLLSMTLRTRMLITLQSTTPAK